MHAIICSSCKRENDPWRKHCGGCGGALPGGCRACGSVNRTDDRFCGSCALPLRATTRPGPPKPVPKPFASTMPIDVGDVINESPSDDESPYDGERSA